MRLRYVFGSVALVIAGIALAGSLNRNGAVVSVSQNSPRRSPPKSVLESPPVDVRNYGVVRTKIQNDRALLWSRHQSASTDSEKELAIEQARELFVRSISEEIFPYWYGTAWDFYGTTETPGEGKIACGYFVSTVLRDSGMKVQRTKLAQQASENIILSLTTNDHTKRFRQVPIDKFIAAVKNWGPGLYVVGLDVHVGFILNGTDEVYFIHSSYVDPYCVVKERAAESTILKDSRYRVLGKLSEDNDLVLKWLRGDLFTTRIL